MKNRGKVNIDIANYLYNNWASFINNKNISNKKLYFLLKEYFNELYKLKSDIKFIDKHDYYIIYFLYNDFLNENIKLIENKFAYLNDKYKDILSDLGVFIGYGYIYDFYIDDDLKNDIENGLCIDLTNKFLNILNDNHYLELEIKK